MKRSEFKKLTKLKKRNAKVVKMVTTTSLSIALIAPSILGSISVLAAEETVPEAVQVAENQAPIQAKAQSYSVTVNWVVNDYEKTATFSDGTPVLVRNAGSNFANVEIGGIYTPNAIATTVGTHTYTMTGEDLGNENTYTVTLVVTDEATAPVEKPKAPQSVSATDDGKFVYASAEQGTTVFVKDENGTIISSYTMANGLDTPVQINLNRALVKGEKVQVVAVNQMTDKESDPTWFTFKDAVSFTNKVIGIDLDTSEELYSYNETGLEGETKEVGYSTIEGFELAEGETPIKIMTFGVNGDVTFYYSKKTTPPVTEKTTLTVKYVDIDTQTSVTTETVSEVESGKEIKLTAKTVLGYTLVGDNEVTVTPQGATQTVTFEYKKDADVPTPTEKTKLTVDFVDMETGKKVSESVVSEVEQGKETTVKAKDIKGFVLQGDATVKVTPTEDNHTITFAYKKEIVNVVLDNATNVKFVEKSDGKQITATVPKGLTLVIVKNGTVIGKSSNGLFARLLTDDVTINLDTRVAKGEIIEYFTEDDKGNSSATANLTREGQEPVDPTEPTEPTNPTNPVDPINPVEPTEPTNPVNPAEPVTPKPTPPVNTVDDKKENLIPQLGESNNLLSTIGMIISASMGFILTKRKK